MTYTVSVYGRMNYKFNLEAISKHKSNSHQSIHLPSLTHSTYEGTAEQSWSSHAKNAMNASYRHSNRQYLASVATVS